MAHCGQDTTNGAGAHVRPNCVLSRLTFATLKYRMTLACPPTLCLADKDNEPGSFKAKFLHFGFFRCLRRANADVPSHPVARWLSDSLVPGSFCWGSGKYLESANNCCPDSPRLKQLATAWRWPGLQTCTGGWGEFEAPLICPSTFQFQSCTLCCFCCRGCSSLGRAMRASKQSEPAWRILAQRGFAKRSKTFMPPKR